MKWENKSVVLRHYSPSFCFLHFHQISLPLFPGFATTPFFKEPWVEVI